ncbi:transglutaminase family protein [Jatrophihabitans telluris]|uniref:Transglutaminase family protein n=1 Tax=Jatrophihabitans telluris TaxID=2038343 RepID=A0ABY4QWQ5_9ACTN|nr:transglutaminase family protein [Jatrophihabitans telluris]UQX87471.1 transglutaminase family protein [Jatrophihabitans telluris]
MAVTTMLEHRTSYAFDRPVLLGPQLVRLRPAPHTRTPVLAYSLSVGGGQHYVNWQQDSFGNHVARLVFPGPVTELEITVSMTLDMTVINALDFFVDSYAERFPFDYPAELARDLAVYRTDTTTGSDFAGPERAAVQAWLGAAGLTPDSLRGTSSVSVLGELNRAVANGIAYEVRLEQGVQDPTETLSRAIGSCRDSGWLLVAAARELGLAARFVSGYLVQLAPDIPDAHNPISGDHTDLHAWAEVFLPGAGWIGLDATSGLFTGEGHIPLAATPRPGEAAPISGTRSEASAALDFENRVTRVIDRPRVTKPYTDAQWQDVLELGEAVDARLSADDVRLTMGGEPTFVSATDTRAPEWNVAADGEDKRLRAIELASRLRDHYAPTGLVQHGQGKWYPGEPLPRWQMAIYWMTDGSPLWHKGDLLDAPWAPATHEPGQGVELAGRLMAEIALRLGIDPAAGQVQPAYPDLLQRMVAETQLPSGPPPTADESRGLFADARADRIGELDTETGRPVGWVLPLHRAEDGRGWATTTWRSRRGRIVLIEGNSPIGMRLPLSSIAWSPGFGWPERSAFAPLDPLPAARTASGIGTGGPGGTGGGGHRARPAQVVAVEGAPTTALTVESREGHLCVFLPPLPDLPAAMELLGIVEESAAALGTPVVLEGYPIPGDERVQSLTVTPDPGVIEVNVQPAASWPELVEIVETLDAAARESGLATEKFGYDGTHTGTGGGSHLTLGGRRPADSPLLRRPSLLVSLLTFWQNHPGLSYLFSGRFIGPTSQAPRVDEARNDSLYELDIAFAELDRLGSDEVDAVRPWTVDRALRHLLTDLTGNTHRAEFCIDKLFSPDSDRGRLGLLELRGFEMPPHPQMSLVQALLVRALVARFWREPYRAPLVRWGTRLHDQFLLPAFVAADLDQVVAELRGHGLPFDREWLVPFEEFRFARLAEADFGGVEGPVIGFELRSAIEPWHVLGEEATGSGTARYVDSSLERLQVRLSGAVPGRHELRCNGFAVALHPVPGEAGLVAGIRYRAWAPPSALHPTIGIHSPLDFEVIDTIGGRTIGGLTYHVTNPNGHGYDAPPVNAGEAEARRAGRIRRAEWANTAASPARPNLHPLARLSEYPVTFDLRTVTAGHGAVGGADQ